MKEKKKFSEKTEKILDTHLDRIAEKVCNVVEKLVDKADVFVDNIEVEDKVDDKTEDKVKTEEALQENNFTMKSSCPHCKKYLYTHLSEETMKSIVKYYNTFYGGNDD